jgi:single-strand DNA-binding protein
MNSVHLIGNVGQDPELRYTSGNNQAVVNLSLATNERFNDKEGVSQTRTEWHRLVFWGKQADIVAEYVRQGDKLGVEGKLQTRKWRDKQGNARATVEVTVLRVHLLGAKHQNETPAPVDEADIPF